MIGAINFKDRLDLYSQRSEDRRLSLIKRSNEIFEILGAYAPIRLQSLLSTILDAFLTLRLMVEEVCVVSGITDGRICLL
jgi:hypothetical protein